MNFDVLIPVAKKDIDFLPRVIEHVRHCIPDLLKIYVVIPARLYRGG